MTTKSRQFTLTSAFAFVAFAAGAASAQPPPDALQVMEAQVEGPRITPLLKYQVEVAWRQDDLRRRQFESIRDEQELLQLQAKLRHKLLAMIGDLPDQKSPLNPRTTGRIQMNGFRIEKLVYESLPGVHVTALVYVPENGSKVHPAVLVPAGHSPDGKAHYHALCQRLVNRGYLVISWDPVGQGERSQFWDTKANKSRYNLICAEHAVLGNLAYLAGTNLARWEIWDGMRAVDYLFTRTDVDKARISITGTSGGGFQAAHIAALDPRIKVAVPSCYITALPMRAYNRIFKDPDSDPEQDLVGMISGGVDHAGLLLLMYPRPVMLAAAAEDFFPIEGTHKTFREVAELYRRFHHADLLQIVEGVHGHQYSVENQQTALDFLDRFNGLPPRHDIPPVNEIDVKALQCTRTGQVMLEFEDARPLTQLIRDYYLEHKTAPHDSLAKLYFADGYPGINTWSVSRFAISPERPGLIAWEPVGTSIFEGVAIDRHVLHHSRDLEMPLLHIHSRGLSARGVVLWLGSTGKVTVENWPEILALVKAGYEVVSFDPRGLGETRMPYKALSGDDPSFALLDIDHAYFNPLSGVLADYVYNSLLTGRPYFLQLIEDAEIVARFSRTVIAPNSTQIFVTGDSEGYFLAQSVAETLPDIRLLPANNPRSFRWSEIVEHRQEIWPIQYLLPGGAYIH